jgi:hypothetical protein
MFTAVLNRRSWVVALAAILLAALFFAAGRAGAAGAEGADGGDGLYNEGLVCFDVGEQRASINIGGPAGYDLTTGTLGFATLQGFGGPNVFVRSVVLSPGADLVNVILNAPARRHVCAAWHVVPLEFAG